MSPSRATAGFAEPRIKRDDGVEVIQRDLQPFQDVPARLGLAKLELRPASNDLAAELDEVVENLEQRQHLRTPADDREHDDAERRLQLRVLVEVVEDDLANLTSLQVDDDPKAVTIGFVADVGNALENLLSNEFRDALDQPGFVDLIRNGVNDDALSGRPSSRLRSPPWRA